MKTMCHRLRSLSLTLLSLFLFGGMGLGALAMDVDPRLIGACDWSGGNLEISGHYAYVAGVYGGFTVFDISNPANPQWVDGNWRFAEDIAVAEHYLFIAGGTNGLVVLTNNLGDMEWVSTSKTAGYAYAVKLSGNYAFLADGTNGLQIFDVSNPAEPQWRGGYNPGGWTFSVALSGPYVYVSGNYGLCILDASQPSNPSLVGACGIGGQSVVFSGDYAYILDGNGLKIVDVSDPTNPQWVGSHDTAEGGGRRLAVSGHFAYLPDDSSGVQILDVSNPANPQRVGGTSGDAEAVVVAGDYLYVLGSRLLIFGLTNALANPQRLGRFDTDLVDRAPVTASGDYAYLADGYGALHVLDISNPGNPQRVGGCNLLGDGEDVVLSGNYLYIADGESGLQILDVSNPVNPQQGEGYNTVGYACGVAVDGGFAYVADGEAGLQIFEVSNPRSVRWLGSYEEGGAYSVAVSNDYAYVAAGQAGVQIIDVSHPDEPWRAGFYSHPHAYHIALAGNYIYLADGSLQVIDVSSPANPHRVGGYTNLARIWAVAVSGNYAYVSGEMCGLEVLDISHPANPWRVGGNTSIFADYVTVRENKVFVSYEDQNSLFILNTFTPLTGPALAFTSTPHFGQTTFHLSVQGLPGLPVQIDHSADLLNWQPWTNCVLSTTPLEFLDHTGAQNPHQFYRSLAR